MQLTKMQGMDCIGGFGSLLLALEGKQQLLALVDAIGIGNLWIRLRDAAPSGGPAIVRPCDRGKRIALLNANPVVRFCELQSSSLGGQYDLRARRQYRDAGEELRHQVSRRVRGAYQAWAMSIQDRFRAASCLKNAEAHDRRERN